MEFTKVERLLVNYKTLEEFKNFQHYGLQELSMYEDLEANIVENDSESPFYGIFFGDKLIARMSLYRVDEKFNQYFEPSTDYLELWKLEVLPEYQGKGYGTKMVDFAKSFGLPVKTNLRTRSHTFWEKLGFSPANYQVERDFGSEPFLWLPEGISERSK